MPRRKVVAAVNENEAAASTSRPKRARQAKDEAKDEATSSVVAKVEDDEVAATDTAPAKRGRRAKADQNDTKRKDYENNDVKKVPAKRGRPSKTDNATDTVENGAHKGAGDGKGVKGAKGAGSGAGRKAKAKPEEPKPNPKTKSIVLKSKAPVDEMCPVIDSSHVFCEGDDVWDCMLNQTDVGNNNNKYYLIQCLESDSEKTYHCWQRWGRIGKVAGTNLVQCGGDVGKAKSVFMQKFRDKTKNDWYQRKSFKKVAGKYDLLEMDYAPSVDDAGCSGEKKADVKQDTEDETKEIESKLDEKIQELMRLIFDVKKMTETVVEMQYDANKAPLGKLTNDQIRHGYEALKRIEDCVVKAKTGNKAHVEACNQFYTRIPHDFGMKRPPLISDMGTIKAKIQLLEVLGDIQIAMTLMTSSMQAMQDKNMIDHHYDSLRCGIEPLGKDDDEFRRVTDFVQKTHGKTHTAYSLDVDEIFTLDKLSEKDKFNPSKLGNRRLLWHGSRLTNWSGILGQGLRIAPPEAPVTGYMFGKGIYFADMCTKSANYCFATPARNVGLILLCEVALGEMNELTGADYNASNLPAGKHSTWGKGKTMPDEKGYYTMDDGTVVPCGVGKDLGSNTSLQYNEFIVYNSNQVRMRYLVKLKFNYKYR